jgi:hypothetical protein
VGKIHACWNWVKKLEERDGLEELGVDGRLLNGS